MSSSLRAEVIMGVVISVCQSVASSIVAMQALEAKSGRHTKLVSGGFNSSMVLLSMVCLQTSTLLE